MSRALEFDLLLEHVATYSHFSLGRDAVLSLKPSTSKLWVEREHQRVNDAIQHLRTEGSLPMAGLRDLRRSLDSLDKAVSLSIEDLVEVAHFIRGILSLKAYGQKLANPISDVGDLFQSLFASEAQAKAIEACFSVEFAVYDQASKDLKHIRQNLRQALSDRERIAQQFIQTHSQQLTEPIATLRQDRVVVLAKQSDKNSLGGLIHGSSASGQSAYVEPPVLLAINNKVQSLIEEEQLEIQRICHDLSERLRPDAPAYRSSLETCGLLDGIYARAAYALAQDGITGSVRESGFIFKAARHPLIDAKAVIANSYQLEGPHRVLLITGPNTGGKTVSLKLIGLFVLCIASGVPVLASEAACPLYDDVFVDIGDQQSIAQSLSTFSAHISNLAHITAHATKHSLVLLDELGSSTDPQEGESLAMAILDDLRAHQSTVIATTHFSKLKAYALSHDDIQVASVQFDLELMKPTFKYLEGIAGQSYALEIAARYQLKPSILDQAQHYKAAAKTELERLQERLDRQAHELSQRQERLDQETLELKTRQAELDRREASFEKTLELKRQAEETKLQALYEAAEEEAQAILDELKQSSSTQTYSQLVETKQKLKKAKPQPVAQIRLDDLKKGQAVRLNATQQIGQVVEVKKKVVVVLINGIRMDVPPHQLSLAQAIPEKKAISIVTEPIQSVPLELNLIGYRVEEALEELDQYLDACLRARLPMARIVHGHGTGALREAVHQRLRQQTGVQSYRLGTQGEGSTGATVVTFQL